MAGNNKKSLDWVFVILISATVMLMLVIYYSLDLEIEPVTGSEVTAYNDNWTCFTDGKQIICNTLPKQFDDCEDDTIVLTKILPEKIYDNEAIYFLALHQCISVKIDGKEVLSYDIPEKSFSKSPGRGWVFIDLKREYENKNIRIELKTNYSDKKGKLISLYYGDKASAILGIVKENVFTIVIAIITMVMGVILCMYYLIIGRKIKMYSSIFWLGLFAIDTAIWSVTLTDVMPLMYGHNLMWTLLKYSCMYMLYFPVCKTVSEIYAVRKDKPFRISAILWTITASIFIVLQIFGAVQLRTWTRLCNVIYIVSAIWFLYLVFRYVFTELKKRTHKENLPQVICGTIVALTVIIDVTRYLAWDVSDPAKYMRLGILAYILYLAGTLMKSSMNLYFKGEKIKVIEEEAFRDVLTKTWNRASFEKDCIDMYDRYPDRYDIVMMDLNSLKYFNDKHGHNMGDYYIIVCSEIIMDVFAFNRDSHVYRIGGDEFCAVYRAEGRQRFLEMKKELRSKTEMLNNRFFNGMMGIASGYAHFDAGMDVEFKNTMKRADEEMYVDKAELKKNQHEVVEDVADESLES